MSEDWFKKGSTSVKLTYQIDDKENKLSLSSGKVFFLKLDENGQKYIGLTNPDRIHDSQFRGITNVHRS